MKVLLLTVVMAAMTACTQHNTVSLPENTVTDSEIKMDKPAKLMTWSDLLGREKPSPSVEIVTGSADYNRVDLWIPEGEGPHPVVLMVHGGCWQKEIADRTLMNYAAEDLRRRGLAVWNIEYRGVDEEGGGYPGTFTDAAMATDAIRAHATEYNLDIENLVAFGHSAGGHLALWLAGRHKLPKSSPLYSDAPLKIKAVVNSGGLADLEYSVPHTLESCLGAIKDKLTGPPSESRPNVYSDTSPAELLPIGTAIISVNGDKDGIAPSILGEAFAEKASRAGDLANFIEVKNSGHVELISPNTHAFDVEAQMLQELSDVVDIIRLE